MGKINESDVDYWLSDDGLVLLEAWARDGYKYMDIAERMDITPQLLSKWKKRYPEIRQALESGKEVVDYKVENALLKSALGFTTKEITVTIGRRQINGEWVNITKETKTKEVIPNVTACLAWLNNRRPDKWKKNRDNIVDIEDEESDVKITIVRGKNSDLDDSVNESATMNQEDIKKAKRKAEKEKDEWEGYENW